MTDLWSITSSGKYRVSLTERFIRIPISEEMRVRARIYRDSMDDQIRSIRGSMARYVGALGEECFSLWSGEPLLRTYNHDLIWKGKTADIKTKDRTVFPHITYEASVYAWNRNQKCDIYIAVSLQRNKYDPDPENFTIGWLIGWMPQVEYQKKALFRQKGHVDRTNNQVCSEDCWNVSHNHFTTFI